MKTKQFKLLALLLFGLINSRAYAHCPANFPEEKVCFMLDDSLLYIYDQKNEHNGPYKDLKIGTIVAMKTKNETNLVFSKKARGIYKIESTANLSEVVLSILVNQKTQKIKVIHE